jgi:hypothetical protein
MKRPSVRDHVKEAMMRSFNTLAAYVIGVLIVWAAILAAGYFFEGSTPGHPILHVFGGLLLGMLIDGASRKNRLDGQLAAAY